MGEARHHDGDLQPDGRVRHRLEHDDGLLRSGERTSGHRLHLPSALHGARHDGGGHHRVTPAATTAGPAFDVVGFGVNALDLIAVIDGFPAPDTKVPIEEFDVQGGGMTATAMVACVRLGLRARYIGKIGTDFWSRLSLRLLSKEGVDVRGVIRAKGSPGHVSVVLADRAAGQRRLFFRRPPAYDIRPAELDRTVITSGRLLHVDGVDAEAAVRAIDWAREAGMRITMDGERIVPRGWAAFPRDARSFPGSRDACRAWRAGADRRPHHPHPGILGRRGRHQRRG
ncbi:MAG: hypothetical protein E6H67_07220 [Betaproteobacteria bacterium]|nr:MAG: hypothetical protein E6H67_07220 [Betaproteobacteria bacterium]